MSNMAKKEEKILIFQANCTIIKMVAQLAQMLERYGY